MPGTTQECRLPAFHLRFNLFLFKVPMCLGTGFVQTKKSYENFENIIDEIAHRRLEGWQRYSRNG